MKLKVSPILAVLLPLMPVALTACSATHAEDHGSHHEQQKIVVTSPQVKDADVTQQYVCQIQSRRHIEVCALQDGYLQEVLVQEGQAVKQGEVMFRIRPTLYQARLEAEKAEAESARIEAAQTQKLYESVPPVVSYVEVLQAQARLKKANAKVQLAEAEVDFTIVKAPFDGIVDRLQKQLGSLIEKKDVLTTLSDNSLMWVYFNVPEAQYLGYKARQVPSYENTQQLKLADSNIELLLADNNKFNHTAGNSVTIEGKFNNETGNIPFRADFPNPEGLLRHGQTGNVLIQQPLKNAIVIPQRATFEVLDKRYVYVVGEDRIAHQREITIQHEMDDIFVIKKGLSAQDKFVLEGVRQIRDGEKIEFEFMKPEEALKNLKKYAE